MTARRRIRRSALAAPCIDVALLCSATARDCASRLPSIAPPCAWWRVSNPPPITSKSPENTMSDPSGLANSQKSRKNSAVNPAENGTEGIPMRAMVYHGPTRPPARPNPTADPSPFVTDFGIVSQMKAGGAVCDKIRECVTTRGSARPLQTRDPAFLASRQHVPWCASGEPGLPWHKT